MSQGRERPPSGLQGRDADSELGGRGQGLRQRRIGRLGQEGVRGHRTVHTNDGGSNVTRYGAKTTTNEKSWSQRLTSKKNIPRMILYENNYSKHVTFVQADVDKKKM